MVDCEVCNRTFRDWHAAKQHMNAVGHWECESCDAEFWTQEAASNHMERYGHRRLEFDCEGCDAAFDTLRSAKQHMHEEAHWRKNWCSECKRGFESESNLRAHLNSSVHRRNEISCPFCKRGFTSATGVTHHLETGSCPQARSLNRDTILAEVRRRDPAHLITKKLLTFHETSSSIMVTSASYNHGSGFYECYLCHKGFRELKSLNNHVNSPAHKERVYHCPGRACGREFRALAPLFNYLESESCGAVRFDTVQKNVGGILSGQRLIGFG